MENLTAEETLRFMHILMRKGYSAENLFDIVDAHKELCKKCVSEENK